MPDAEDGRRTRSRGAWPGVLVVLCLLGAAVGASASDGGPRGLGLLVSPRDIRPGDTVRVLAVSETPVDRGKIAVQGPSGIVPVAAERSGGGPPFWWKAEFEGKGPGSYTITLGRKNETIVSRQVAVGPAEGRAPGPAKAVEPRAQWDLLTENL